jgi:Retrotransposon gag protein
VLQLVSTLTFTGVGISFFVSSLFEALFSSLSFSNIQLSHSTMEQGQVDAISMVAQTAAQTLINNDYRPSKTSPPKFSGTPEEAEDFCFAFTLWCDTNNVPAAQRVRTIVGSCFSSTRALTWARQLNALGLVDFNSMDMATFTGLFLKEFMPPAQQRKAILAIGTLRQGSAPVRRYVAAFRSLMTHIPPQSDLMLVTWFMNGLDPAIAGLMEIMKPKTILEAFEYAGRQC